MPEEHHITEHLTCFKSLQRVFFKFPNTSWSQFHLQHGFDDEDDGEDGTGSDDDAISPIERCNDFLGVIGRTMEVATSTFLPPESVNFKEHHIDCHENCILIADSVRKDFVKVLELHRLQMETWFWEAEDRAFLGSGVSV